MPDNRLKVALSDSDRKWLDTIPEAKSVIIRQALRDYRRKYEVKQHEHYNTSKRIASGLAGSSGASDWVLRDGDTDPVAVDGVSNVVCAICKTVGDERDFIPLGDGSATDGTLGHICEDCADLRMASYQATGNPEAYWSKKNPEWAKGL